MWIVPWDPILKKNLLKSVLVGPVNSAWDPQKKRRRAFFSFSSQSKPNLTLVKQAFWVLPIRERLNFLQNIEFFVPHSTHQFRAFVSAHVNIHVHFCIWTYFSTLHTFQNTSYQIINFTLLYFIKVSIFFNYFSFFTNNNHHLLSSSIPCDM